MDNGTARPERGSILERAAAATPTDALTRGSILERASQRIEREPPPVRTSPAPAARVDREPAVAVPLEREPAASRQAARHGTIDLEALAERGFVIPEAPANVTAEEFRLVKRQLLLNAMARGPGAIRNGNLILVGSSMPDEGKTFCSINLALSIASERDLTVMLVDADFGKPEVLSTLGIDGGPGLIDVVADRGLDVGDCLIRTNIPNLTVLPAGRQSHLTTELIASERMGDIIEEIAKRYTDRIVIFDSPPALVSSAASVLAMHAGQVVYVVAAEMTREGELREGLALMSGCPNVQLLLNRSRFAGGTRRFASYYGYGS